MKGTAKAHTNIALIKYWGKRNDALILPTNSSLSLTLDGFYTKTTVEFRRDLSSDLFLLNDQAVSGQAYERVSRFLDLVRKLSGEENIYAEVNSRNEVPTAAGFASSASGFAALAAASTRAIGLELSDEELSILTRQGSGSACRSIYGGFVEWQMGEREDGLDSRAVQVAPEDYWDVRVAAVELSSTMKKVSSREGMKRTVDTSPFYSGWLEAIPNDLMQLKAAIKEKDFEKLGAIAEANCLKMHATTLGANPPFTYWHDTTVRVMHAIQEMRSKGIPVFFTIDAGPNVKALYLPEHEEVVKSMLENIPGVTSVTLSRTGKGISYL
ncbi:diphosphomevalonate decarboxylase [Oceanobacillus bengalensis]|uniref:diphosphomevalonate decarboxylase n=1 Tax=Oceanobacillus bengalensis TaxID=1435466 RepID=A0A494YSZ6_9BACI|nr:diphosphomevalonate decarboxylase [Oceanobacillus bengalensis]RKQ13245.1 diphosphomevalonate decarboxylase [Oceanobacillus bengalensis]